MLTIVSFYLAGCAILPALIGLARGHGIAGALRIATIGALFGWTGYGALWAWMDALIAPDRNVRIIVR